MRAFFLAAALALTTTAATASEPPNARAAFVERRGLIESDAQCRLFNRDMRAALEAGAGQARGALLRAGWSRAQLGELEQAVVAAARARRCDDQRTLAAAAEARTGFATWMRSNRVDFEGWARTWSTRRVAASDGWRLRQDIDTPARATFGIRESGGARRLVLMLQLARGETPPATAHLAMRDSSRTNAPEIALQQRISFGLNAGVPSPSQAMLSYPSTRTSESTPRGASFAVFAFPDAAFVSLLALDPRESVEIVLQGARGARRLLVEVGDVAAARSFLLIGAG
ncbi:MAG: hypothetical protein ABL883_15320 [Terricaulis sp.]